MKKNVIKQLLAGLLLLAVLCSMNVTTVFAQGGTAENTIDLADYDGADAIHSGIETALASADVVTVTGTRADVNDNLNFTINHGKTVKWQAAYTTTQEIGTLIEFNGDGTFVVDQGAVLSTGKGIGQSAIAFGDGNVIINDGASITTVGQYSNAVNGKGNITVNGGTLSGENSAVLNSFDGLITMNGGVIQVTGGNAIQGNTVMNGGTLLLGEWGGGIITSWSENTITINGGAILALKPTATALYSSSGSTTYTGGLILGDTTVVGEDISWSAKGSCILPADAEIFEGKTFTILEGATLEIPNGRTLANNGTLNVKGTLENKGTLSGNPVNQFKPGNAAITFSQGGTEVTGAGMGSTLQVKLSVDKPLNRAIAPNQAQFYMEGPGLEKVKIGDPVTLQAAGNRLSVTVELAIPLIYTFVGNTISISAEYGDLTTDDYGSVFAGSAAAGLQVTAPTTIDLSNYGDSNAIRCAIEVGLAQADEMTITGARTDVDEYLLFEIKTGKTVRWKAIYTTTQKLDSLVEFHGEGTLIIEDGAVMSTGDARSQHVISFQNGNVIINGGRLTAVGEFSSVISGFGNITINGGYLSAKNSTVVFAYEGAVIMNGGTIQVSNGNAIEGDATMNGGTILIDDGGNGIVAINGKNIAINGGAIMVSQPNGHAAYNIEGVTTYTGGLILGNTMLQEEDFGWSVKGSCTLPMDAEIFEGKTFTILEGGTLEIPKGTTLTNNGTLDVWGEVLYGEPDYGALVNNGIIYGILSEQSILLDTIAPKTYGDAPFELSVSGQSGDGEITFESSDPSVISIDGQTATIHKAGEATITATIAEDRQFFRASNSVVVTVEKRALTFTPDDITMTAGDKLPEIKHTVDGLVKGDTIVKSPSFSASTDGQNQGTYAIKVERTAELSNQDSYKIYYADGTLNVLQRQANIPGGGESGPTINAPASEDNGNESSDGIPKTGDDRALQNCLIVISVSAVGFIFVLCTQKKSRKHTDVQ